MVEASTVEAGTGEVGTPDVGVVVTTHNALPWIEQCLASVEGLATVIVDNDSSDDTVAFVRERFPAVTVIEQANRGLAAGWTRGLEELSATRWALILNADAWLVGDALARMVALQIVASAVLLLWAFALVLFVVQRDLGSALLFFGIFLSLLYVASGKPFYVVGGLLLFASAAYLLPAYAGAFLGTTVVKPGRFNAWGTVIAAALLVVGVTGLQLLGAAGWVEQVFNGAALVIAVTFARLVSRRNRA